MTDGAREEIVRQVAQVLEEAERPMRAEEILPHMHPVMPSADDVAEVLAELAAKEGVKRDGSFYLKRTPPPIDQLFPRAVHRKAAHVILAIVRDLDGDGRGARSPRVLATATERGIPSEIALDVLTILRNAGEIYSVGGDRMRAAKS